MKNAEPPLALFNQLLWREFFYAAAFQNPNFDRMKGNPICLQIPWDKDSVALRKWSLGKTGFPWIDAIMTQLREEGWVHFICRHAVVCFLTRGDLWISWEEGMKVRNSYSRKDWPSGYPLELKILFIFNIQAF
ncbi:Cryptochrome-1 [Caligus rogercresseyi]|uniref:Cryptochrome-1 n=1 Tax=Caligus rogercresseyi TaxID=217165 RepID=A0A7T8KED9_CALRO|nr:Cryptochrome-1 [Caligus rogercresseyi]